MLIYYFTRTGKSRSVAETLAKTHGTQARQINDHTDWQGKANFIKGGYMSSTKKSLPVDYVAPEDCEQIALVFPIWASSFPPAVRTFVEEVGRERIIAVPTSMGGKLSDRDGFIKVLDMAGKTAAIPSLED